MRESTEFQLREEHVLLALETSCDDTSIAVLKGGQPLALRVSSQTQLHRPFGGVVPELASRQHLEVIHPLLREVLAEAGLDFPGLHALAVTKGPGLAGSLLVGVAVAKMISSLRRIPVYGVNHLEGHLYSARLEHDLPCPFLCLICSGGHTQLVYVPEEGRHQVLGQTRDDAAGEAFDKVAKMVGLSYPGGPVIDKLAQQGDPTSMVFPRPMKDRGYEFSFSGLKTAVRRQWQDMGEDREQLPNLAASFQEAVVDVLLTKLFRAARDLNVERVAVVGGVACNSELRRQLLARAEKRGLRAVYPQPIYCTDNAAMIGRAAWDLKHILVPELDSDLDVDIGISMLGEDS